MSNVYISYNKIEWIHLNGANGPGSNSIGSAHWIHWEWIAFIVIDPLSGANAWLFHNLKYVYIMFN